MEGIFSFKFEFEGEWPLFFIPNHHHLIQSDAMNGQRFDFLFNLYFFPLFLCCFLFRCASFWTILNWAQRMCQISGSRFLLILYYFSLYMFLPLVNCVNTVECDSISWIKYFCFVKICRKYVVCMCRMTMAQPKNGNRISNSFTYPPFPEHIASYSSDKQKLGPKCKAQRKWLRMIIIINVQITPNKRTWIRLLCKNTLENENAVCMCWFCLFIEWDPCKKDLRRLFVYCIHNIVLY